MVPAPAVRLPPADDGFALVEAMVATALISIVMAALTSFFATAVRQSNQSGGRQAAAQLATAGIEAVRGLPAADLRTSAAIPGGRWTPARPAGSEDPENPVRGGVAYARAWTVVACWQPPAGGDCGAEVAGYLPFLRLTVTVTWSDRRCAAGLCSFTTATIVSNAPREPVFTT